MRVYWFPFLFILGTPANGQLRQSVDNLLKSREGDPQAVLKVKKSTATKTEVKKSTKPVNPYLVVYAPKSDRDPMFSVADKARLAEIEANRRAAEAERKAKEEEERRKRLEALRRRSLGGAVRRRPRSTCKAIKLQGIIESGDRIAAILNGDVRYEGDKFKVKGYRGLAVVKKVMPTWALIKLRNRNCRKRIQ